MTTILVAAALALASPAAGADDYFAIRVVDAETGRGVPLIELRTVNQIRYVTDSAGIIAFHEPGLMDADVFFHVGGHGYEHAADGFGFRGRRLRTTPGALAEIQVTRKNIAERLYRVTGEGIYRDSLLVNRAPPHARADVAAKVLGSDSIVQAFYRGKLYWFWGDTNRAAYPLGNFHVPGAVSALPGDGGLAPDQGVQLEYFVDKNGFAAETCRMPGGGPTWINGLTVLESAGGQEALFASYMKIKPPLELYERGIARFNDERQRFEQVRTFPLDAPAFPHGHPFHHPVDGVDYVWFGDPFPLVRAPARESSFLNLEEYESFTCLLPGVESDTPHVDRDEQGRPRYAWRKNARAAAGRDQGRLIQSGAIKAGEQLILLRDVETGKPVVAHAGNVAYNAFRRRWVMIAAEVGGTSFLGETWFAEADTPLGPWCYARKVVSHDRYSFYNPRRHPRFDEHGGRVIYFEGTYTHTFSGNDQATPRYDYNQVMYRLNLADERLALPAPVWRMADDDGNWRLRMGGEVNTPAPGEQLAFFALDRAAGDARAVTQTEVDGHKRLSLANGTASRGEATSLFFALPHDVAKAPETTIELWEFVAPDGAVDYSTDPKWRAEEGWRREGDALCRVWPNPWTIDPWTPLASGQ